MVLLIIVLAVVYYALEARRQAFAIVREKVEYFSTVNSVDDENVTLSPRGDDIRFITLPIVGLVSEEGSIVAGGTSIHHPDAITRQVLSSSGSIRKGSNVRTDLFVSQSDPKTSLGISYDDVEFESELGFFKAWEIRQNSNNWVIFIHGHRSNRRESLRFANLFRKLSFNQLMITYRNDQEALSDTGGYHMFGLTEWKDLEGAVKYVVRQGGTSITLFGHSMGGSIVLKLLLESSISCEVENIILESPALDLNAIVLEKAKSLPFPALTLLLPAKKLVSKLVGFDWKELNYLSRSHEFNTPILLIHSEDDRTVPVKLSDLLAAERPDLVTYVRLRHAPHAAAWNVCKEKVETSITSFLEDSSN